MAWDEHLQRILEQRPPAVVFLHRRTDDLSAPLRRYAETHGFRRIDGPHGAFQLWVQPDTPADNAPSRRIVLAGDFPDS